MQISWMNVAVLDRVTFIMPIKCKASSFFFMMLWLYELSRSALIFSGCMKMSWNIWIINACSLSATMVLLELCLFSQVYIKCLTYYLESFCFIQKFVFNSAQIDYEFIWNFQIATILSSSVNVDDDSSHNLHVMWHKDMLKGLTLQVQLPKKLGTLKSLVHLLILRV